MKMIFWHSWLYFLASFLSTLVRKISGWFKVRKLSFKEKKKKSMLTQRSGELMIFSEHMVQIHEFLQTIQKILSGISWLSFKMRGNHQSMDHKQINWSGEGFGIMFPRNLVQDVGSKPSRKVFQEFIQIRKSSLHRPREATRP